MSVAQSFKALLDADSAVRAIVGPRGVAMHEVPAGVSPPYVLFSVAKAPEQTLLGNSDESICTIQCACWAVKADQAEALSVAVKAACAAHDQASTAESVTLINEDPDYDAEVQLDVVVLTIEWWP